MIDYTRTPGVDYSMGVITPELTQSWLEHAHNVSIEKQRRRGPDPVSRADKLKLFGTESVNAFSEAVARAIRGTASLAGDEDDMESLDNHIARARDFLRGPSPYYAGQDKFTVTPIGDVAAEVGSYIIPYLGLKRSSART